MRNELYRPGYGLLDKDAPDYSRCCAKVSDKWTTGQCSRKRGHGPDGAYCKQHDPVRVKERDDRQFAKWKEESADIIRRDRLLAAAPDMMAALKAMLTLHEAHYNTVEHAAARAAIAKAEGRI